MPKTIALCGKCNAKFEVSEQTPCTLLESCESCGESRLVAICDHDAEELERYPIYEPYIYVSIVKDIESFEIKYLIIEPELSDENRNFLEFLHNEIIKSLDKRLDQITDNASTELLKKMDEVLATYDANIDEDLKKLFFYFLNKDFLGFGMINPLMQDSRIEDISCDGAETPLFIYHREYESMETNIVFDKEDELSKFVVKLAQSCGKHISKAEPMLDATMPDGSRIQMTLSSEITTRGSTFTIRKFRSDPITPIDLIDYQSMSVDIMAYLWMVVEHGLNAMIAGGTASGKTSVLNAISLFIPHESKIVSIEETREINLPHSNWIPGVTRIGFGEVVNDRLVGEIDLFDLMKAALRQRPEYIIVGEIRGKEAYVLFQAMATGHTTYSTMHADSTQKLVNRLEGKPINVPRQMLQSLDVILIQINVKIDGKNVRRTKKIVEIIDIDTETQEIITNEVFHWNQADDQFIYNQRSYSLERIREMIGFSTDEIQTEFKHRKEILLWMQRNHIRDFKQVAQIVDSYREQREELLEQIREHPDQKLFVDEHEKQLAVTVKESSDGKETINDDSDDVKNNGFKNKVQSIFFLKNKAKNGGKK